MVDYFVHTQDYAKGDSRVLILQVRSIMAPRTVSIRHSAQSWKGPQKGVKDWAATLPVSALGMVPHRNTAAKVEIGGQHRRHDG